MNCPRCNCSLTEDANFCKYCGLRLTDGNTVSSSPKKESPAKKQKGKRRRSYSVLLSVFAIILIAVISVAGVYIIRATYGSQIPDTFYRDGEEIGSESLFQFYFDGHGFVEDWDPDNQAYFAYTETCQEMPVYKIPDVLDIKHVNVETCRNVWIYKDTVDDYVDTPQFWTIGFGRGDSGWPLGSALYFEDDDSLSLQAMCEMETDIFWRPVQMKRTLADGTVQCRWKFDNTYNFGALTKSRVTQIIYGNVYFGEGGLVYEPYDEPIKKIYTLTFTNPYA